MTYDVFLSHASADKPEVEILARRLRDDGLEPFLDKWHLVPGEPWQEALEDALEASRTCAVFLGKAIGPWQNEEMRVALDERVRDPDSRVIPVLLPDAGRPHRRGLRGGGVGRASRGVGVLRHRLSLSPSPRRVAGSSPGTGWAASISWISICPEAVFVP